MYNIIWKLDSITFLNFVTRITIVTNYDSQLIMKMFCILQLFFKMSYYSVLQHLVISFSCSILLLCFMVYKMNCELSLFPLLISLLCNITLHYLFCTFFICEKCQAHWVTSSQCWKKNIGVTLSVRGVYKQWSVDGFRDNIYLAEVNEFWSRERRERANTLNGLSR